VHTTLNNSSLLVIKTVVAYRLHYLRFVTRVIMRQCKTKMGPHQVGCKCNEIVLSHYPR